MTILTIYFINPMHQLFMSLPIRIRKQFEKKDVRTSFWARTKLCWAVSLMSTF